MSEVAVFDALKYHIEVDEDGTRCYRNNAGEYHRTNGPAVEYVDGYKAWYQNGLRHRMDGPAIEYTNGYKEWYINGEELTEAEFNQRVNQKQNV